MVKELEKAKKAIQSLWTGVCNIFWFKNSKNKYGTVVTEVKELCKNIPCRLSLRISARQSRLKTWLRHLKL